ncbi:hypothetical protein EDC14_1014124 [Hydrogenispora ethanolica]|uniref:Uncharacterized protein n=1 Tax=Hydrogenispora ethanolica TaxID=1082276 RepID=A0A4R1RML7_HYDET|nr:hypothetical protein [Hydrogenispora ethanolica]TCL67434.1 hypothetical protein EDC14_1014124 [Hydrogenispora ethanolica]
MKKQDSKNKGQQLSPLTWIVIGVGIVAIIYLSLPQQPQRSLLTTAPQIHREPGALQRETAAAPAEAGDSNDLGMRNPFEPPPEVVSILQSVINGSKAEPANIQTLVERSGIDTVKPIVDKPKADEMPPGIEQPKEEILPVWQGIIGTTANKLALVGFKNKSYLLKIGDRLSDSDYRLTEIQPDAILLQSATKQLRLGKTKEAK